MKKLIMLMLLITSMSMAQYGSVSWMPNNLNWLYNARSAVTTGYLDGYLYPARIDTTTGGMITYIGGGSLTSVDSLVTIQTAVWNKALGAWTTISLNGVQFHYTANETVRASVALTADSAKVVIPAESYTKFSLPVVITGDSTSVYWYINTDPSASTTTFTHAEGWFLAPASLFSSSVPITSSEFCGNFNNNLPPLGAIGALIVTTGTAETTKIDVKKSAL